MIEVYADPSCPFAHVGLIRLIQRRNELGLNSTIRVRAWPLEFVNGVPLDPATTVRKVAALRAQVAPELFKGFHKQTAGHSTISAMALEEIAYLRSDMLGLKVSLRLRHLYFEQGHPLTEALLERVANEVDLQVPPTQDSLDSVNASWEVGKRRGVIGSPHFFTATNSYFCPSLKIGHDGEALVITATPAMLDAVLGTPKPAEPPSDPLTPRHPPHVES